MILGCGTSYVSALVQRGILFAWQKDIGKSGSRVWFSRRQLERIAAHPLRLKMKQIKERLLNPASDGLAADSGFGESQVRAWEQQGVQPYQLSDETFNTRRDYGEYYTARQVARLLGVSYSTVRMYRLRRRLIGYRKPLTKHHAAENRRWWFFKKEDVHALLNDPEYRKNRQTFRRSRSPEGKASRAERELKEFFKGSDEYIPHDPRNIRFLPPEVRRRILEDPPPIW